MSVSGTSAFRRLPKAAALIVLLVTLVFLIQALVPIPIQASESNSLRIATYNLSDSRSNPVEDTANLIARSGATIVLLQQLDANEAYLIARSAQMDVAFFLVTNDAHGLAVLSQSRIVFDDGHLLTSSDDLSAVQRVQTLIGGQRLLTIYNVGLGFRGIRTTAMTDDELSEVFTIMTNDFQENLSDAALVLGGTFNDISGSSVEQQLKSAQFSDPFAGLPLANAATISNSTTQARLDYLWLRRLQPSGITLTENPNSDRRMAVVEIPFE